LLLISVVALHFLAGSIAGSLFAVRTLLMLVALVLIECVVVAVACGLSIGLWSLGSLLATQVGYLSGVYIRSVLENAGVGESNIRSGRGF
jgi:hypothetical protein